MSAVPVQHAQALAGAVLRTWPITVGLTIEHLGHHDQGPHGAVTFAVVHAADSWPGPVLVRCDGYGQISRGCEHPRPDGRPCWHPSASHLTLRDPGLCPAHLPPLAVGDWARHPDQPFYGRVTRVEEDGNVTVDFGRGEITLHTTRVPRVPPHIAAELEDGPLSGPLKLLDE